MTWFHDAESNTGHHLSNSAQMGPRSPVMHWLKPVHCLISLHLSVLIFNMGITTIHLPQRLLWRLNKLMYVQSLGECLAPRKHHSLLPIGIMKKVVMVLVYIQFYLFLQPILIFLLCPRTIFEGEAINTDFSTERCLKHSCSVPCLLPHRGYDVQEEAETKQVPLNSDQTHLCLGPKGWSGKSYQTPHVLSWQLHPLVCLGLL